MRLPRGRTVRERLLLLMVGLMAFGLLVSGVVTFVVQYTLLNERIEAELNQEVAELQEIAEAGPNLDGRPYDDVAALFQAFLAVAVSGEDEALMGLVDGQPAYRSGGERRFDIFHEDVLQALATTEVPEGRARLFTVRTQGTELQVLAADVRLAGEDRSGTFVVAIDVGRQRAELYRLMTTFAVISLVTLALAGVLGNLVLRRLLQPLRELREATAEISTENLSRRLEVDREDTDVAELAMRFNGMLDRLDAGVQEQRQFLDDAAHELRTPLTIIRGNTELMSPDDPDDVASSKELILAEVDRMRRLVDDLLMLARSQRPDFVTRAPTDVTELALEAMERITALGDRAWRLRADAEGTVEVDQQRITQAVIQLAANAVKFSEPGTQIELSTRWVEEGAPESSRAREAGAGPAPRYLAVAVRDQGQGIPEGQVDTVLARFGRAENVEGKEGFGLGLAIVDVIARAHGGAVTIESLEGVGSIFTVWLPSQAPGVRD
ncbi:sensor histidine kinase [Ornithinimicrobium panacihumi]|uniref:sensor histidine kinase n=1 Tax=Ornithinimicrobium panacihumi TaxID=2008449 RepID=UPI003F8A81E7